VRRAAAGIPTQRRNADLPNNEKLFLRATLEAGDGETDRNGMTEMREREGEKEEDGMEEI
jgi:hypothetical protein